MGTQQTQDYLHSMVIPEERAGNDNLTAVGAGGSASTDSSYSQSGPRPGVAEPAVDTELVVETSGSQSAKGQLELLARRAGHPTPTDGAFVWRDVAGGDGTDEYKGRDRYMSVTGWDPFDMTADDVLEPPLDVLRLASGKLLCTGLTDSTGNRYVSQYDPSTSTWGTPVAIGVQDGTNRRCSCLVQLDRVYDGATEPRVLLFMVTPDEYQIDVHRSDDEGATWTIHSQRCCDVAIVDSAGDPFTAMRKLSAAHNDEQIVLFLYAEDGDHGNLVIHQWASSDLGGTLQEVARASTPSADDDWREPSVSALPEGGFVMTCHVAEYTTAGTYSHRFGSAYTDFREGLVVAIWTGLVVSNDWISGCSWIDEDGVLYALYNRYNSGSTQWELQLAQSRDFGASWSLYESQVLTWESNVDYLNRFDCTSTAGRAALCTRWYVGSATTYEGDSVACVWLGGYSEHTLPDSTHDSDLSFEEVNALGYAPATTSQANGELYLPVDLPAALTWTGVDTWSTLTAAGELQINPTAATQIYQSTKGAGETKVMLEFAVRVPAGQGSKTTDRIAVKLRLGDGAGYEYEASIQLDDTGFRIYDVHGAAHLAGTATPDFTSKVHVRVAMEKFAGTPGTCTIRTWYASDAHAREWTESLTGTLTDRGGAYAANRIQWGHLATSSDTSHWSMVGYSYDVNAWSEDPAFYSLFCSNWSNPECLSPAAFSGLPVGVHDGVRVRARSGPCAVGQTWDITTRYDHPVSNLDPRISGSPSRTWRSSADNVEEWITWDLEDVDATTWLEGDAICCFVLNSNVRQVVFEGKPGAGAWVTLATMEADTDYSGIRYERNGVAVRPDEAQVTTAERYLFPEDHVGDTFDLGAGGEGNQYRKILHNSGGAWRGSGVTTMRPTLILEDVEAGNPSSGTGAIWRRSFGAVVSSHWGETYDHYRIRIPAQHTRDDYYEIGNVVIGTVRLLARRYDRGYQYVHVQPLSLQERPDLTTTARPVGKLRRELTFSWVDTGFDLTELDLAQPDVDYVAIGSGNEPAGVFGETGRLVEGIVRRAEQATCPVLLLTALEKQTGASKVQQESRTRAMFWGRIVTDPMSPAVLGHETRSEFEQLQPITMIEEV